MKMNKEVVIGALLSVCVVGGGALVGYSIGTVRAKNEERLHRIEFKLMAEEIKIATAKLAAKLD